MRILMVSAAYPPYASGVATATANLANCLSQSQKITLFAGGSYKTVRKQTANQNFTIYWFPGIQLKRQKAFLTIPYPQPKKVSTIVGSFRPELIHVQDFSPLSVTVLGLAKKLNIPVVATHHFTAEFVVKTLITKPKLSDTLSNSRLAQQLIYRLVSLFYNHCDLVTVPNANLIPYFKKAGLKQPIVAIPNGIFLKNFRRRIRPSRLLAKYHIKQPQIILFVGRIEPDKNIDVLIDAFSLVHQYNPQTSLVLVGDGNKKHQLSQLAKGLNLTNSVYFLNKIANHHSNLSHVYNAATVFASASSIETQGLTFIEAMAAGLPIVYAKTAILDNAPFKGLGFESGNAGALAVCLQKILTDHSLRTSASKYNRQAGRQYDIAITSRQYLQAYQSLKKD